MNSEAFLLLPFCLLREIVKSDFFVAQEIEIVKSVLKWHNSNPDYHYCRLKKSDFIRGTGFFQPDAIVDALIMQREVMQSEENYLEHPGLLLMDKLPRISEIRLEGNEIVEIISIPNPTGEVEFWGRRISIEPNGSLTFVLYQPHMINNIRFCITSKKRNGLPYSVIITADDRNWFKVTDYSTCICTNSQNVFFIGNQPKR